MARLFDVRVLVVTTLLVLAASAGVTWVVLRPAWKSPMSRAYESRLGYAALLRARGEPFPVVVQEVREERVEEVQLGEGLVQSTPLLVPVLPMARVLEVLVEEGDAVVEGQLLARLDLSRSELKLRAAVAALATARAEFERVRVGSPQAMEAERPGLDGLRVDALEREVELQRQRLAIHEELLVDKLTSLERVLELRLSLAEAEERLSQARWTAGRSAVGMENSLAIAATAVQEAELELGVRRMELADHEVRAPAAGVVQKVYLHPGEFNQDPGRPAFLLAVGLWFEAHLDQALVGRVAAGDAAEVVLEAGAGEPLAGVVARVLPFVAFSAGGPEAPRPFRPLGTGAPEWPATFKVRIALEPRPDWVVPGLTGYARLVTRTTSLAAPRSSLLSLSAATALVRVVREDGWETRQVRLGLGSQDWVEVLDGLVAGERVMVAGFEQLEDGDPIRVVEPALAGELGQDR